MTYDQTVTVIKSVAYIIYAFAWWIYAVCEQKFSRCTKVCKIIYPHTPTHICSHIPDHLGANRLRTHYRNLDPSITMRQRQPFGQANCCVFCSMPYIYKIIPILLLSIFILLRALISCCIMIYCL